MPLPGDQLEALCQGARQELLLVAPFIKREALRRLLTHVQEHIAVKCVTRWRPDEIASGVSDIEIWTLIQSRPLSSLWLRADLHAKFYRADESCLVGSANLTGAALGWSQQPNLELLLKASRDQAEIRTFENTLLPGCIAVDDDLYRYMKGLVEDYSISDQTMMLPNLDAMGMPPDITFVTTTPEAWLPSLRHPEMLFTAYCGKWDLLTSTSREAAAVDLAALPVSEGLSKKRFEAYVGLLLLQKPVIRQVDEFVAIPKRFGAVSDLLKRLPCVEQADFVPSEAWQTLMRWLKYFLPQRYTFSIPNHSEIISRVQHD